MNMPHSLRLPMPLFDQLQAHLFPGDGDEHGAVIAAGVCNTSRSVRLLARDIFLATDGVDYVAGQRGYRMLTPQFIARVSDYCARERLAYLPVHNHCGRNAVHFSKDDLRSHERGYPALLDIVDMPVGALVFAENAVAGDVWLTGGGRVELDHATVVGSNLRHLYPQPLPSVPAADPIYDRHARLFGDLERVMDFRRRSPML